MDKNLLILCSERIMELLDLPEEYQQVDEWVCAQRVSLVELQNAGYMAQLYEIDLVVYSPKKELPLLLGNLKSDLAKITLERIMKS